MYPNEELINVLAPAYGPCPHLLGNTTACPQSRWESTAGHVPRGFLGATGELGEVELVIVLAEPGEPKRARLGNPGRRESYVDALEPTDMLRRVVDFVYGTYVERNGTVLNRTGIPGDLFA